MTETEAERYDAWYRGPRGRWIGDREYGLLRRYLRPLPEESVLDVGCGTGYFTRRFALDQRGAVVGVDPDPGSVRFARLHAAARERYEVSASEALPFATASFDLVVSITALCFSADEPRFVREMARVARRAVAIGLLNRTSLLWRREGRGGGNGGYRAAHWHTPREALGLLAAAGIRGKVRTALLLPSGSAAARRVESLHPARCPWGGFLLAFGYRRDTP